MKPFLAALRRSWQRLEQRLFIERQLILRTDPQSNPRVSYAGISVRLQKIVAVLVLLIFGWVLFSSLSFLIHGRVVANKNQEIERHRIAYFDLLTDVQEYHQQFSHLVQGAGGSKTGPGVAATPEATIVSARLDVARARLGDKLEIFADNTVQQRGRDRQLGHQIAALRGSFLGSDSSDEKQALTRADETLGRKIDSLAGQLARTAALGSQLSDEVAALDKALARSRDDNAALKGRVRRSVTDLSNANQQLHAGKGREQKAAENIDNLSINLSRMTRRVQQLESERSSLSLRVNDLESYMAETQRAHRAVLERFITEANVALAPLEEAIGMTGVSVETLVERVQKEAVAEGQGGPHVPLGQPEDHNPYVYFNADLTQLNEKSDRLSSLRRLMQVIPLGIPTKVYRVTSRFGARRDPFTGKRARHDGIDVSGVVNKFTYTTGAGRVRFAGRNGPYGLMIIVDHGAGFTTRYGHLRKILVKTGQELKFREKIGVIGSTGRSTGPHLHYEIRFEDRPYDPHRFITAGYHVQQKSAAETTAKN